MSFIFIVSGPPRLASATCGVRSEITVSCAEINVMKLSCLVLFYISLPGKKLFKGNYNHSI